MEQREIPRLGRAVSCVGFGAWQLGGTLDLRLVNVVWVNDALTAQGKVREEVAEGAKKRLHLDVWCEKPDGTKATVGTATVLQ